MENWIAYRDENAWLVSGDSRGLPDEWLGYDGDRSLPDWLAERGLIVLGELPIWLTDIVPYNDTTIENTVIFE